MRNFILRTLTGFAYVCLIVFCILMNSYTLLALTVCLTIWAMIEFNSIHRKYTRRPFLLLEDTVAILCGVSLSVAIFLFVNRLQFWGFAIFFILLCTRMIIAIYSKGQSPLSTLACSLASILYIAVPLALLNWVRAITPHAVLAMFVLIWLNDTGAFLVGSLLGRHKMFPRISPKKSWEGLVGGFAACLSAAIAIYILCPQYFDTFTLTSFIGFGLITAAFATWGDLMESLIKRTAGIKDSGTLLPGHGGILDRIDSLLMVSPIIFAYMIILLEN